MRDAFAMVCPVEPCAWARTGVPALISLATAQAARIDEAKDYAETCNSLMRKAQRHHETAETALAASEAKLAVAVEVIKALRAEWYLRDLQASDFEAALAQINTQGSHK